MIKRPDVLSLSLSLSLFRNDRYLGFVEPTLAAAPVLQLLPVPGVVLLRGLHHRVQGKPLPSTAFAPPKRFARTLTRRFPLSPKKRAVRVWPERERPGRDPDGGPILVAVGGASSVVDGVQRQPEGKCECTLYSSPSLSLSLSLSLDDDDEEEEEEEESVLTATRFSQVPILLVFWLLTFFVSTPVSFYFSFAQMDIKPYDKGINITVLVMLLLELGTGVYAVSGQLTLAPSPHAALAPLLTSPISPFPPGAPTLVGRQDHAQPVAKVLPGRIHVCGGEDSHKLKSPGGGSAEAIVTIRQIAGWFSRHLSVLVFLVLSFLG